MGIHSSLVNIQGCGRPQVADEQDVDAHALLYVVNLIIIIVRNSAWVSVERKYSMEKRLLYEHLICKGLMCNAHDGMFAHANYYDMANNHLKEIYCFMLAAMVGLLNNDGYACYKNGISKLIEVVGDTIYNNIETEQGIDDILDRIGNIGIIL